jgi:hypothetical protein
MTALQICRDDGPLAGWVLGRWFVPGRPSATHPLEWLVPPLLRALEYGTLIALTATVDPGALPLCFAFLGVLAFHHYDTVYRLRHQRRASPPWVRAVGGGWDGRLLLACILAVSGGLRFGLFVAAVGLALVFATESTMSWLRFGREQDAAFREDEDVDED